MHIALITYLGAYHENLDNHNSYGPCYGRMPSEAC
jgi:hypothetical protein